jgi:hypothetical protein
MNINNSTKHNMEREAAILPKPSLPAAPSNADLAKIAKMYLSDDAEDKHIAYNWLMQLVGMKDANANLFILTFYKDWESDNGERIDEKNWWDLNFKTYPVGFGRKNYKYTVTAKAVFGGIELVNEQFDYSRFAVGNGQPKWDFCRMLCDAFRKSGHTFYDGLFRGC